jgi:hypothetical protein
MRYAEDVRPAMYWSMKKLGVIPCLLKLMKEQKLAERNIQRLLRTVPRSQQQRK